MTSSADSLITCPHCGQSFALNEAVLNQHRAEIERQFQVREQAAQKAIAEKRALQKHWSRREKELDRAIGCTASLYGSVQGIAGAAALPDIAPLALPDGS